MFAQRAFNVIGEEITLVDVATHLAHPAAFAVLGFLGGLWLGFDVLLVIVVGHGGLVGKYLGIKHIGDKHGVRADIDALGDTAGEVGVGVLGNIEHMVDGTVFCFAVGEFVHLAARLEPEMFEDLHRRLGGQHADVEDTGIFDKVMGVIALVDRHGNPQRVVRDLGYRIHDAAVVDVVVVGGQDIKAVTYVE